MKKLLALNRGEIAIRIMRAATELGLRTVAVFPKEDALSLHRFKADEAYQIGEGKGPVQAYLDVAGIVALAKEKGVDAIHPGYGFLSENPALPRACEAAGITFVGPSAELLELLGDKTAARRLAAQAGVPDRSRRRDSALTDAADARSARPQDIGFPLIIKAAFGGGGRGMRVVESADELVAAIRGSQPRSGVGVRQRRGVPRALHPQAAAHRGADPRRPARQRAAPATSATARCSGATRRSSRWRRPSALDPAIRAAICDAAVRLMKTAGYYNAGTVEFLLDSDTNEWFFIEVNPRIQVEHTVTEMVTGIDLVRCQILVAQGHGLHGPEIGLPHAGRDAALRLRAAVPRDHRGPAEQLRARLRQDPHLPVAGRLRHPARRRIGLRRRGRSARTTTRCS